ncbi:hypothetical protein ES319_A02G009900v1 [Gossypium barbadense]|uniref:Uncharacterized protein n=1 Tax=Gossypium barbadense TaxID=3634 RepID=A0A5J5WLN1_GOSBA|nr:hypothetical protein ES319_A02G009900v1 [Gossypium barbadense]
MGLGEICREWSYLKEFFINIEPWSERLVFSERITWIEVSGVPMHCWNYETLKRIAGKWGNLVSMGENLLGSNNFEKIEMLISTSQVKKIDEMVLLEVGDVRFPVSVRELGWLHNGMDRACEDIANMGLASGLGLSEGQDGLAIAEQRMDLPRSDGHPLGGEILPVVDQSPQETKLVNVSEVFVRRIWGDDNFDFRFVAAVGRSGGLITIWDKSSFIMKKEYRSNRFIVLEGIWCVEGWEGVLINVYDPNLLNEQKIF